MSHIVSVLLESPAQLDPDIPGLPVHGANLATAELLRRIAVHEGVDALEVFLPPTAMVSTGVLAEAAARLLPPSMRNRGRLRFYPIHSIPRVWPDGFARVLFCLDPEFLPRDRYLRDSFATGPMPIACDTHALGHHRLWGPLARFARSVPVAFDSIVCLSRSAEEAMGRALEEFRRIGNVEFSVPCRLDRIPRGVDVDLFRPADAGRREDARRALRLPVESSITLYLGRVTPHGKADLLPLVRSFAGVTSAVSDVLLIAGEGYPDGYGAKLVEYGRALGLGDRLIVHGSVPPVLRPQYYAAADIFVFPGDTVQETMGNTVLEAMASGLPCVVSDWDGMRDLVVDGETGRTVPTWWMPGLGEIDALSPAVPLPTEYLLAAQRVWVDTRVLGDALADLLLSPETRSAMGAAGRKRVAAEFSWPKIVDRWVELWDELAAGALAETEDDRSARRAGAAELGLSTPYTRLFSHYATGVIAVDRDRVRLSSFGNAVALEEARLQFYDELLPVIDSRVVVALFALLRSAGSEWTTMAALRERVAVETSADQVLFHVCVFLKRGLLELQRK